MATLQWTWQQYQQYLRAAQWAHYWGRQQETMAAKQYGVRWMSRNQSGGESGKDTKNVTWPFPPSPPEQFAQLELPELPLMATHAGEVLRQELLRSSSYTLLTVNDCHDLALTFGSKRDLCFASLSPAEFEQQILTRFPHSQLWVRLLQKWIETDMHAHEF